MEYYNIIRTEIKYKEGMDYEDYNEDYEYITIDMEDIYDSINKIEFDYPMFPDPYLWESYLKRSLKSYEREIIHNYLLEKDTNLQIKALHYNLIGSRYFHIPKLTKHNGNCLWEDILVYLNLYKNI